MGNKKHRLVGAPRFELGTSCTQGRRNISRKSFLFNLVFENKRVRKTFGSGRCTEMWLRMHRVPPIPPAAKKQRNASADCYPLNSINPSVSTRRVELSREG